MVKRRFLLLVLVCFWALTCYEQNCSAKPKEENKKSYQTGALLYEDDFEKSLDNWVVEQRAGGRVFLDDGTLRIDDSRGCTIWFKHKLDAPVMIEYEVEMIKRYGGKHDSHDGVSDLNCFWMVKDPNSPEDIFAFSDSRSGRFQNYHSFRLYYVGVGAHGNTRTRFRRYAGDGSRPLLAEHDLSGEQYMLKPHKKMKIQLITIGNTVQYIKDGRIIYDINDPAPYHQGWFGFRTFTGNMKMDNFRVYRLKSSVSTDAKPLEDSLHWFRDAHFGMFIHWGLYAVPAGQWNGKKIPGIGEWIMKKAPGGPIPVKEYEKLTLKFNPVKFDANQWVKLAKDAGMKYIVITAKHHDGFAMFDSKCTEYDIADATAFNRDPMKELAEACKKHGIKLGFYYSHARDWHHPDAMDNDWDYPDKSKKDFRRYMEQKAIPQVRELLTQYGPIAIIWYDTAMGLSKEKSIEFKNLVHSIQPGCLVSGRVGNFEGDYQSMGDNRYPPKTLHFLWETPATLNDTWGYKYFDDNWKSVDSLIYKLVNVVSKGGNYLLNVGPTAEGLIPQPSADRLREMGKWLAQNGESIYGCKPTPFKYFEIPCTVKADRLYFHLFDWPDDSNLQIPGLKNDIQKAWLLADEQQASLPVHKDSTGVTVDLPPKPLDCLDTVVVLQIKGRPDIDESPAVQNKAGVIRLGAENAAISSHFAKRIHDEEGTHIGNWIHKRDYVTWDFAVDEQGTFTVTVEYACDEENSGKDYKIVVGDKKTIKKAESTLPPVVPDDSWITHRIGGMIVMVLGNKQIVGTVKSTGSFDCYVTEQIGTVNIKEAGTYVLSVLPPEDFRNKEEYLMNLKSVSLKPTDNERKL